MLFDDAFPLLGASTAEGGSVTRLERSCRLRVVSSLSSDDSSLAEGSVPPGVGVPLGEV